MTVHHTLNNRVRCLTLAIAVAASVNAFADRQTSFGYNALGQVTSVDGPRTDVTDVTHYEYDLATANLLSVTNAAGHQTTYSNYTNGGLAQTIATPNGAVVNVQYDWQGKVLRQEVISTDGTQITTYGYDKAGQLTSVQTPNGLTLSYEYDGAQRLIAMSNSEGERIEYTLDSAGNITAQHIKDSAANIVKQHQQVFDDLSRLRQHIGGTDNQTTQLAYDGDHRNTAVTDPKNNPATQNSYDALNRLTQVVDSANGVTTMTYNAQGLIATVTDPRGLTTTYGYNGFGELESIVSPDTGTTSFTHDAAGNVTSRTNANGTVVNYAYDALNRLTEQSYPADPTKNVLFDYDNTGTGINGNANYGLGQLTKITYFGGQIEYQYDQLGRLVAEQRSFGGNHYTTEYRFNAVGQFTQMVYPSGRLVNYQYDTQGRLSAVTTQENAGATAQTVVSDLQYLPFGPTQGFTYGNGIAQEYRYDLDYRLTDMVSNVQDWVYRYDLNSNIESITNNADASDNQSYGYDELNRLTSASGAYGDYQYSYDAVGNRTQRQIVFNGETIVEDYTYKADANQLTTVDTSTATVVTDNRQFVYSESGQLLTDINNQRTIDYQYDENDRLAQAEIYEGPTLATYQYNPLGQRIIKTYEGDVQHLHYNAQGQRIAESDADGNVIREYIYLGQQAIAMFVAGSETITVAPWVIENDSAEAHTGGDWPTSTSLPGYTGSNYTYAAAEQPVLSTTDIYVDNAQATITADGELVVNWDAYDDGYYYVYGGHGAGSVTWPAAAEGLHSVWVTYQAGTLLASNATYTVHHVGGSSTVVIDQKQPAAPWVKLGDFELDQTSTVVLTDAASGDLFADAIKLTPATTANSQSNDFVWELDITQTGAYRLYANWTSHDSRANNAAYTIVAGTEQTTVIADQTQNGGSWQLLGTFELNSADSNAVRLSPDGSGWVIADSIRVEPVSTSTATAGLYYIHNDHLGTPKLLTDAEQNVVWEIHTTPFGEVHQEIANGIANIKAFPGQYRDSETGLSYNYYRDYDPSVGRYIQSDPIGLNGGLNTYGYAYQNPIMYIDPYGLDVTITVINQVHTDVSISGPIIVTSDVVTSEFRGIQIQDSQAGSCECKDPLADGSYGAFVRTDRNNVIELTGTASQNLTNIQLHVGNAPTVNGVEVLQGCISPGTGRGGLSNWVTQSGTAMQNIINIINSDGTNNITVNVITNPNVKPLLE